MTRRPKRGRKPPDPSAPAGADRARTGPPDPPEGGPPPSRRAFLWKAWLGLAGLAVIELIWVVVDSLRPRRRDVATADVVVVAGPVDHFAPASVTAFPAGRFYLVRTEEGGFLAVSRACTHLGCTVPWSSEEYRFVCPCHGSAFDLHGDVVNPPAPRALDLFEVRIENHIVKVNTANVRRRRAFDPQQVTWA
ncbi:MAG: ubiquinol-cytochrome c reductase iron-sulfur subunit [Gemmatimonadota bacterium]|nr:ubiquinol-cytochrome c reductase iron-sulfur subunit [Gemmatimonadota bacterium]MDH5196644.1 ubiquinol-cytochrome c reductase iron-sulfur subunit [Gemmatimonadota bacterium]